MIVKPLTDVRAASRDEVGGKAANLGELLSIGMPVPPGFVLRASAGAEFIRRTDGATAAFHSAHSSAVTSCDQVIALQVFESNVTVDVLAAFRWLGVRWVSVRSSATIEDSAALSFAGLFDSRLGVDENGLLSAVKECWLSVRSDRVRDYCKAAGVPIEAVQMAVVVQELIVPDAAGVCFTANPLTGNCDEMYIEAVWGFGDQLVAGCVSPDSYVYHWPSRTIGETQVVEHSTARRLLNGRMVDLALKAGQRHRPILTAQQLHHLATMCDAISEHYGTPQDIEFAIREDDLFILQSRPITTIRQE